jgi:hypothetical protein
MITVDEIAERLVRPSFYLSCAEVDRRFDERPKYIPTLAVVQVYPHDYTATYDRAGESVPPPGRGWQQIGTRGASTFYRREPLHEFFADVANVSIRSRYNSEHELLVLDAVVRGLPEKIRRLVDEVFCDSKHGWAITLDLSVDDKNIAAQIGGVFASGLAQILGGHGDISVSAGRERLHYVEAYWRE